MTGSPGLAIVGGGPWCTYALERLCAELPHVPLPDGLDVTVIERTGRFGSGAAHDDQQPTTNYLNRVASQLSFAADESNREARHLLAPQLRPTFVQWCRRRFAESGDRRFDLGPRDVPRRYLHGIALREMFDRYVDLLRSVAGVRVRLHAGEVIDIEDIQGRLVVRTEKLAVPVDHVLLVTGQSENRPAPGSLAASLQRHAARQPHARYVPSPYPLGDRLTTETVPPGCRLGVLGLGLTSIDLVLHLTEGRGGSFVPVADGPVPWLRYQPAGAEPRQIVAVSPSGLPPWCRPDNQKADDGTGNGHAALEHKPAFLTLAAVAALRASVGRPTVLDGRTVRQLDFEAHIFPLVVLEMAYAYHRTLLGSTAATQLRERARPRYLEFLNGVVHCPRDHAVDHLLAPVAAWFDEVSDRFARGCADPEQTESFRRFVFGDGPARTSPWGHSTDLRDHAFDWRTLFDPLDSAGPDDGTGWQLRVIRHLRRDITAAVQGNLRNPVKAACDGVWRDLRQVFSAVLDFGGLTARSHRQFREVYLRHYARMSNGTGVEPMLKLLALVESGVLDLSVGPDPVVEPVAGRPAFRLRDRDGQVCHEVDVVVEGRGHPFDPHLDRGPLYRNLIRRGLLRQWRNPAADPADDYLPGAIDVSPDFHPRDRDGWVDERLTVLGAPVEGMVFFQLSAARPHADSSVINLVARWANNFVDVLAARGATPRAREGAHS
ncbi:FAD/NAD(P)-binding protein [Micromonospora sp. FIMYZ51]|uniref:FAD/NAD(P)-binding protein n=1 Tax=Micromonospora sp. FIMYZ51 TaxID=3051832 RepID=UPI00311D3252